MSAEQACDVIVVGGGIAGLVTAVRAAELGLSVTLLEKGREERYLCNARMSGGVFHLAFHDPKTFPDELLAAVNAASGGYADPVLTKVVAQRAGNLVEWLRGQGARFIRAGNVAWQNYILAPPRLLRAGIDWMGRGPDVLLRQLSAALQQRGGKIRLGARGHALVMDNGRCTGIEADVDGQSVRFSARAVVLADGGFQSNLDMVRQHISPEPGKLKQRGGATGTGDGMRMAQDAGAALTTLDRFYGHLLCRDAMHSDKVWPYPELDGVATASILVDTHGRRFADEGMGGVWLANTIARQPDPLCATIVFDAKIWEGPGRSARIPANPSLANAGGTIHTAPTLDALAAMAGLHAEILQTTVAAYNEAVRMERTDTLSPPRSTNRFKPWPIEAPPFYAIPVCAGITYTMGGIRIDADARVLRPDGSAIDGLYAAGSTTGGLEGGARAAYLGGLTKAGVQGLCAAEHIARTLSTDTASKGRTPA
ncbi:MAG: FAD-dependent oxidoreductase [Hyphomicrobiaceae bacterium]